MGVVVWLWCCGVLGGWCGLVCGVGVVGLCGLVMGLVLLVRGEEAGGGGGSREVK